MLANIRDILKNADEKKYGQGAFNVNAVSQIKAAIETHEILKSPAVLQGANLANGFMGGCIDFPKSTIEDKKKGAKNIGDAVRKYAKDATVPVVLHLDHGLDFESCVAAIEGGYSSVMIDGSALPFKENMELTREVVKYAHARGISVEGELGVLAGVEDDVAAETSTYTNPLDAIEFFKNTKVDSLALSYGTKHGPNKGKDTVIRKQIPIAVRECMKHEGIDGFLVSHGSSTVPQYIVKEINQLGGDLKNSYGIDVEQLVEVSRLGINKINVDTDIRLAVTRNMRQLFAMKPSLKETADGKKVWDILNAKPDIVDPRGYLHPLMNTLMYGTIDNEDVRVMMDAVERGVQEIISALVVKFGSWGHADEIEVHSQDYWVEYYKEHDKD